MAKLQIENFLGINKKADPADIDQHECQKLDGFDIYTMPGALVKRGGYVDQAGVTLPATYPTGLTIKNFYRFRVTRPSAKTITVVHGTVGGKDRVYVSSVYSGGAWTDEWVELTEQEESLTGTVSGAGFYLQSNELSSSADDYYKGWYVFDFTRKRGSLVTSYNGTTKVLTLKMTIMAGSEDRTFSIYRFPMITQYEGDYTAATDSSAAVVMDAESYDVDGTHYELRADSEDAYYGWTVYNSTRSNSAAVTASEVNYANNYHKLSLSTDITGQAAGDTYCLYNPSRTILVDDKIHFYQRPNVLIMATGNTARYPKQFPFWYGYIRKNYFFGQSGNSINEGYYLEPATLDAPDDDIIDTIATSTAGGLDDDTYYFACAYVYDGYQVGPLTSAARADEMKITTSTGNDRILLTLKVGYSTAPSMRHSRTLSKRVTAVQIYMSNDLNMTTGAATWYKIKQLPIRQDHQLGMFVRFPDINQLAVIAHFGRDREPVSLKTHKINWTGSDPYTFGVNITSYEWDNKGFYYSNAAGGMSGDKINYAAGTTLLNYSIVGHLYGEGAADSLIAYSPLKPDGTPSHDWLPTLNTVDMAQYGIVSVTAIVPCRDFVYVVGGSKTIRLAVNPGLVPTFRLDMEFPYVGTDSPQGVLRLGDGVLVCSKRGLIYLDNTEHLISSPIEDTDNFPLGVTTLSEAYMAYNGETQDAVIVFPTDKKLYAYNIALRQWAIHSVGSAIGSLATGDSGELYGSDGSKIFRLNQTKENDDLANYIDSSWKSKVYNMGTPDTLKTIRRFSITYKSDTVFTFNVYTNRSATAFTWNNERDNWPDASATVTTAVFDAPSSMRGYEFEFEVCFDSYTVSSVPGQDPFVYDTKTYNTYLEIHNITVEYVEEDR